MHYTAQLIQKKKFSVSTVLSPIVLKLCDLQGVSLPKIFLPKNQLMPKVQSCVFNHET
jgi:hypothetical protein